MKRFWHACLAVIASATMTAGVANAQNDWNAPSEIGSYQSILSRAGYGNGAPATNGRAVGGSGTASFNGPVAAGSGNAGGGFANDGGGFINGGVPNGGSGTVNGSFVNGGMVTGEVVNSGNVGVPFNGSAASGVGQPFLTQPRSAAPVHHGGGGCSSGACGGGFDGGFVDNSYSGVVSNTTGYIDPAYDSTIFAGGGYNSAPVFNGVGAGRRRKANWVVGLHALSFARDYEDDVLLSQNPSGDRLFTTDADEGDFGGYGVNLTRRQSNGKGIEFRYWALNTGASARLDGFAVSSQLPSLVFLEHIPSARDALSIFDSALFHVLDRETDINNFEVNLLNNGGHYKTRRGRSAHFELIGGFRWFQFDERLFYTAVGDVVRFPIATEAFTYQTQVNNDLIGFQLGARNELCFTQRLRGFFSVTTGVFNNNIKSQQNFFDANGAGVRLTDGPEAGQIFDFKDEKNDVAIIGELDAGVTFQVSPRARARFGYRTFGVAGVALAADQIPADFRRAESAKNVNSNGSLLLHGGYAGMEFCF